MTQYEAMAPLSYSGSTPVHMQPHTAAVLLSNLWWLWL